MLHQKIATAPEKSGAPFRIDLIGPERQAVLISRCDGKRDGSTPHRIRSTEAAEFHPETIAPRARNPSAPRRSLGPAVAFLTALAVPVAACTWLAVQSESFAIAAVLVGTVVVLLLSQFGSNARY